MGGFVLLATCFSLFAITAGCKKEEAPAPAAPKPAAKPAAPVQAVITAEKKVEYVYEPAGKRDPFKPFIELEKKATPAAPVVSKVPLTPLQTYDLSELRLTGVLILPDKKVAMIEDPTGKGYNVRVGTLIGRNDGRVVDIRKDEVIVEERYTDEAGQAKSRRVSVMIPREEGGER